MSFGRNSSGFVRPGWTGLSNRRVTWRRPIFRVPDAVVDVAEAIVDVNAAELHDRICCFSSNKRSKSSSSRHKLLKRPCRMI